MGYSARLCWAGRTSALHVGSVHGHSALAPPWRSQRRFSANQRPVQCNCLVPGRFAARAQPRPKHDVCMHECIPGGRRSLSLAPTALYSTVGTWTAGGIAAKGAASENRALHLLSPTANMTTWAALCTTVSESGRAGSETKIGRACVGKGVQPTSRSRAICWRQESVAVLLV